MNAAARPWIAIVFKCLAVLALIFAFVFFMRMQEEQSLTDRYRSEGTVSRAIITDKEVDTVRYEGRRGLARGTRNHLSSAAFAGMFRRLPQTPG